MTLLKEGEYARQRIEAVARRQSRLIAIAFARAARTLQDELTLVKLADMLERGLFEDAIQELSRIGEAVRSAYGDALVDAARDAERFLNSGQYLDVRAIFSGTNPRMLRMFDQEGLRMVQQFSAQQTEATRQAIRRGMQEGLNPRDMARDFRRSIGLTKIQESHVANFERQLRNGDRAAIQRALMGARDKTTLTNALARNRPLTEQQIGNMVDRYRAKYVAYRAEVIGRTEALRAAHQGSEEMFQQMIDEGNMDRREVVRTWVTGRDERVRESHQFMNGQLRLLGEKFVSGLSNYLEYPGDPTAPPEETIQCRCIVTTRLVPGGVQARERELANAI